MKKSLVSYKAAMGGTTLQNFADTEKTDDDYVDDEYYH